MMKLLVERDVLHDELRTVFDEKITETLLSVLDRVASQVYEATVPRTDFSRLEQIVERIAERQEQTAIQLQELIEAQKRNEEAQKRNEERFIRVETDIEELKSDVSVLKTDVSVLKSDVSVLKTDVSKLKTSVGHLEGQALEEKYTKRAAAYFGSWLRRPKVVDCSKLYNAFESRVSSEDLEDILLIDLVVKGKLKQQPEAEDVYLVVEVSVVIDKNDVERAQHRAKLLQNIGFQAIPVVAGEKMTEGAEVSARTNGVAIVQDGGKLLWNEAVAGAGLRVPIEV